MPAAIRNEAMHYGAELARIHHDHFGGVAGAAVRELLSRLSRCGITSGTVCDLAAGTGISSRALSGSGFQVWGVDISEEMLRIARAEAPAAGFVHASLWDTDLPPCVAVAAVGEAFSYAADPSASHEALGTRFASIHRALEARGVLLFDVAAPGRSGPAGSRRAFWTAAGAYLGLEEREEPAERTLTRNITLFLPAGALYRKIEETHVLRTYAPEEVEAGLARAGFRSERLSRYDDFELLPGWHAWAAYKL